MTPLLKYKDHGLHMAANPMDAVFYSEASVSPQAVVDPPIFLQVSEKVRRMRQAAIRRP